MRWESVCALMLIAFNLVTAPSTYGPRGRKIIFDLTSNVTGITPEMMGVDSHNNYQFFNNVQRKAMIKKMTGVAGSVVNAIKRAGALKDKKEAASVNSFLKYTMKLVSAFDALVVKTPVIPQGGKSNHK